MQFAANVELTPSLGGDVLNGIFGKIRHWAEVSDLSVDGDRIKFTVTPRDKNIHLTTALGRTKDSFPGMTFVSMRQI